MIRTGLSVLALTGALWLSLAPSLAGGTTVGIVVVREHGVGSQTLVQPYLDRFAALAAALNGWGGADGRYFTSRDVATAFIEGEKPHYGILALPVFLAMRSKYDLRVLGRIAEATGGRYWRADRTADLEASFLRILEEMRTRYLLAYEPAGIALEGRHVLNVRLRGGKGRVRARSGYTVGPARKTPAAVKR